MSMPEYRRTDTKKTERARIPSWLKRPIPCIGKKDQVLATLSTGRLHTVCQEAKCPNRAECFSRGSATFLIMGDICTRGCRFCSVTTSAPLPLDADEPARLSGVVGQLGLSYVVITSVTRDDLSDGGASHFASVVSTLRKHHPKLVVEVLTPDFQGNHSALKTVLDSNPHVLNHNVETVPRLYPHIRPQAIYERSLQYLSRSATYRPDITVKSGFMVGLGEKEDEVITLMHDLHYAGCRLVTIGQYLQPTSEQVAVAEFIKPEQFQRYARIGQQIGFDAVISGPFVRSSYKASEAYKRGGNAS
ncbi:MAG: lipoyl synthase [Chitinivibrionales bacterium]